MNTSPVRGLYSMTIRTLALGLVLGLGQCELRAQSSASAYGFASRLPRVTLADPTGKNFKISHSNGKPTVVLVSVPNMSQGGLQQDWVNSLSSLSTQVNFYLVEDMKGTMFQSIALGDMKSDYQEGDRPVVLIDMDGSATQQLGAAKGKTCVMIYNSSKQLVYVQVGNASPAAVQAVNNAIAGVQN